MPSHLNNIAAKLAVPMHWAAGVWPFYLMVHFYLMLHLNTQPVDDGDVVARRNQWLVV